MQWCRQARCCCCCSTLAPAPASSATVSRPRLARPPISPCSAIPASRAHSRRPFAVDRPWLWCLASPRPRSRWFSLEIGRLAVLPHFLEPALTITNSLTVPRSPLHLVVRGRDPSDWPEVQSRRDIHHTWPPPTLSSHASHPTRRFSDSSPSSPTATWLDHIDCIHSPRLRLSSGTRTSLFHSHALTQHPRHHHEIRALNSALPRSPDAALSSPI